MKSPVHIMHSGRPTTKPVGVMYAGHLIPGWSHMLAMAPISWKTVFQLCENQENGWSRRIRLHFLDTLLVGRLPSVAVGLDTFGLPVQAIAPCSFRPLLAPSSSACPDDSEPDEVSDGKPLWIPLVNGGIWWLWLWVDWFTWIHIDSCRMDAYEVLVGDNRL